ncbi:MAG: hypothetical protein ACP5XB_21290 [Isosphaeraceae bacterium]
MPSSDLAARGPGRRRSASPRERVAAHFVVPFDRTILAEYHPG